MTEFTLDISGTIFLPLDHPRDAYDGVTWEDLSPFEQGYIGAAFESAGVALLRPGRAGDFAGFSDVAPEALAAVLRDCEKARSIFALCDDAGAWFWAHRKTGQSAAFPPLTLFLGNDGKVRGLGEGEPK